MTPVLYILMRTDLDSMNPGKAMAQASHAGSAFARNAEPGYNVDEKLYEEWRQSTPQGFGTVLVLGVTEVQMRTAVQIAESFGVDRFPCDIIHDPTYPLQDGDTTHFIPIDKETSTWWPTLPTKSCFVERNRIWMGIKG